MKILFFMVVSSLLAAGVALPMIRRRKRKVQRAVVPAEKNHMFNHKNRR